MLTRRTVLSMAGIAVASASSGARAVAAAAAVSPTAVNPLTLVNPQFRPALEAMLKTMGPAPQLSVTQMRAMGATWTRPLLPTPTPVEKMVPGPVGSPEVRVYVVGAEPGAMKPCVLHIHGGGYFAGSAGQSLREAQGLAVAQECVVVTVDYRLAPETRFPGSLEDNYAALKWLYANAALLGIDRNRIALKGESAGGGHAAALAIVARDRGEVPIALQVLIYPMLDDRTGTTRAVPGHVGAFIWTPLQNRMGWQALLGMPPGTERVPRRAVPSRMANVAGLPPTFIGVGSIDLFCDEDIDFARRLTLAGVPTELLVVPGAYHAFDILAAEASLSQSFSAAWQAALRRAFNRSPV